jgi:hypothetical protein
MEDRLDYEAERLHAKRQPNIWHRLIGHRLSKLIALQSV